MNQLDMKGRSAVVTGAASGIGLAIARRLAQSGANVAIWDMNEKAITRSPQRTRIPYVRSTSEYPFRTQRTRRTRRTRWKNKG